MKTTIIFLSTMLLLASCANYENPTLMQKWDNGSSKIQMNDQLTVNSGDILTFAGGKDDFANFELSGMAMVAPGSTAALLFHNDGNENVGYEVLFHNGDIDGSRKTGSLSTVRNLYFNLVDDGEWFPFDIAVRGKNIAIKVNGVDVVCYTEPTNPYRVAELKNRILGAGNFALVGHDGRVDFKELTVTALAPDAVNPADTLPPVDEQNDDIIKLQQQNFPVIDYHVHLKGGMTREMAHARSMNYGINYGVAPNAYGPMTADEGGYGTMYQNDEELQEYYNEVSGSPFLLGIQGEGRKWLHSFSNDMLNKFDYLFTDGMTVYDQRNRLTRTYHADEVHFDISKQAYMDMLVNQFVKILSNEPADFFANSFYIPDAMMGDFDMYWTDERIDKVLDVLEANNIAIEINARRDIPSYKIINRAKARGIKFTFGTNNMNADFSKLEYCMKAMKDCNLTVDDMWFPSMSTRWERMNALEK